MTIYYLYVKTHKITGLKYLGQTKSKDPYKYPGSGKYWKRHLMKYGNDISTEILHECLSIAELKELGLYYSALWNVVEDVAWANLKPEDGIGGFGKLSPESRAKIISTKKLNGTFGNNNTAASIAKGINTKRLNGTLGKSHTSSDINKMLETRRYNGTMNTVTPASIAKGLETRLRNGSNKRSVDSINQQFETRRKNNIPHNSTIKVCCIHCEKEMGVPILGRYHGNKCKTKH